MMDTMSKPSIGAVAGRLGNDVFLFQFDISTEECYDIPSGGWLRSTVSLRHRHHWLLVPNHSIRFKRTLCWSLVYGFFSSREIV